MSVYSDSKIDKMSVNPNPKILLSYLEQIDMIISIFVN